LSKLFRGLYIGEKHTAEDTILRNFKNHREASKAMKDLQKSGLIISKPTASGKHISLNKNRIAEIKKIIGIL
jgi:hypothetical protein